MGSRRTAPAGAEVAADDDELGVEDVDQHRRARGRSPRRRRPPRAARRGRRRPTSSSTPRERDPAAGAALEQRGDGHGAGDRLQAAAVAAAADRAGGVGEHVADLARDAVEAPIRSAPEDEPGADAGGDAHVDQVVDAAGGAEDLLAEGADVGVVLELHGDAEARLHLGRRADAVPAGEDPLGGDLARRSVDRRREAHADAEEPVGARCPRHAGSRARARRRGRGSPSAAWSTSAGDQSSATSSPERSQIATRMCSWPKSSPTAKPAPGTSESSTGGRPVGRGPSPFPASRSSTTPAWPSSSTSAETVARERPVQRARSVRLDPGWR